MSPKRIAVIGLKGGVGKTTMTVMLSQAAADAGEVVTVIDADPQGSATAWATNAGDDLAPTVIGQASAGLARTIDRLDAGSTRRRMRPGERERSPPPPSPSPT